MLKSRLRAGSRRAGTSLALAFGLLLGTSASADVQRLEAIGTVPVRANSGGSTGLRDQAIQAALREAVSRVARNLLLDAGAEDAEDASLEAVLGKKMVPYTTRFRILDDRGERPALFADDGRGATEYVVVVDVYVDAVRVKDRLREAGLLEPGAGGAASRRIQLEVRGLTQYPAYEAMRELITGPGGALSARPVLFERGVAVFDVELPGSAAAARDGARSPDGDPDGYDGARFGGSGTELQGEGLIDRLAAAGPPALVVDPIESDSDTFVVSVRWTPPPADPGER